MQLLADSLSKTLWFLIWNITFCWQSQQNDEIRVLNATFSWQSEQKANIMFLEPNFLLTVSAKRCFFMCLDVKTRAFCWDCRSNLHRSFSIVCRLFIDSLVRILCFCVSGGSPDVCFCWQSHAKSYVFSLRSLFLLTVSCVLLGPALFLPTVSSESPSGASGSALPGPQKRSLGFPRPEIVFAAIFYKRFYEAFGTRPISRNLASPAQVSPDGLRSLILLTVSCVLLVPALLLLTVSYGFIIF